MAKHRRSRARRRNPTGTILVNPSRKRRSSKRAKHSKRAVSLAGLLSKVSNPRRHRRSHGKRRHSRRNPLLVNPKRRRSHGKRRHSRRNPLLMNPRRRSHKGKRRHGRRHARRNPLLMNPKRHRKSRRHGRRRNPSTSMGGLRLPVGGGLLTKAQAMLRKLPLVGGALSAALGGLGGALAGAVAVVPIDMAMPYVSKYVPDWLKPYGYTAAGLLMSGIVKALPFRLPYKNELAVGLTFAGGAIDTFRYRHGQAHILGDADGSYYGNTDLGDGDLGDLGNDGTPFAAVEYAGASLSDADYAAADLSSEEMAAAELGRANYYRRFKMRRARIDHREKGGASEHAAQPGAQWAWLIYWIGFDNFQKLASYPEHRRREIIEEFKRDARLNSRKLLQERNDNTVTDAETAGLLVAA